jgi:hypothetical protein
MIILIKEILIYTPKVNQKNDYPLIPVTSDANVKKC